jgi:NurA-like 5'-3' nuclease
MKSKSKVIFLIVYIFNRSYHSVDYVSRYATKEAADAAADDSSDEEDMSSVSFDSSEDEAAGMEL